MVNLVSRKRAGRVSLAALATKSFMILALGPGVLFLNRINTLGGGLILRAAAAAQLLITTPISRQSRLILNHKADSSTLAVRPSLLLFKVCRLYRDHLKTTDKKGILLACSIPQEFCVIFSALVVSTSSLASA